MWNTKSIDAFSLTKAVAYDNRDFLALLEEHRVLLQQEQNWNSVERLHLPPLLVVPEVVLVLCFQ